MRKSIFFVEIIYVALIEQDGFSSTYESIVFLDVALQALHNITPCHLLRGICGSRGALFIFVIPYFYVISNSSFFCSLISVLYIKAVSYSHFVNSLILSIYFFLIFVQYIQLCDFYLFLAFWTSAIWDLQLTFHL